MDGSSDGAASASPEAVASEPSAADVALLRERKGVGEELERSESDPSDARAVSDSGVPGLNAVKSLINATYFSDLLCHLAYKRFKHDAMEARVAAMISAHPRFAWWCRVGDWFYRALAALVLLGTLTAVAVGTILRVFFA
jgi:hypothetical protein